MREIRKTNDADINCHECDFVNEECFEGEYEVYCGNENNWDPQSHFKPYVDEYVVCDLFKPKEEDE